MICACIRNLRVVGILEFQDEAEYQSMAHEFDLMVDVANYTMMPQIGWTLVGDQFNYGQLNAVPSVKITKLSFRSRFTRSEKNLLKGFSILQVNSSIPELQQAAFDLLNSMDDQRDSTYIDLMRSDTISGVRGLVQMGILNSARANVILTTPPTYEETYKG